MSIRFYAVLAALGMIWFGEEGVRTSLQNRDVVTLKAAEYAATKSDARWLKLTDCFLSFDCAAMREKDGRVDEVFVPVRPLGDDGTGKVHVLLASRDARYLSIVKQLEEAKGGEEMTKVAADPRNDGFHDRAFQGLVQEGVDLNKSERQKLAGLQRFLTPDFVILDHGKEPNMTRGLVLVGGGLAILAFFFGRRLFARKAPARAA